MAKPLGFTEHARRAMEEGRFLTVDVAYAVLEGLVDGKATAARVPGRNDQYLIQGPENLNVGFAIKGPTVVVLTVFQRPGLTVTRCR